MSKFNQRFKELKEESGLTLKDLSKEIHISAPNLSYYMNNREPNYDILVTIADYFDVTTDYLTGRSNQRNPKAEMVVDNIRSTSGGHTTANQERIQDLEKNTEYFYNILIQLADAERQNGENYNDIWESIETWLKAMQTYCQYLESLSSNHYPIDIAKETMDTLTISYEALSERIFNMLRDICIDDKVPTEIKSRVVMHSSFGIRPPESKSSDSKESHKGEN